MFTSKEFACAAKAGRNLIQNQQYTKFVTQSSNLA
ncbi:Uncharacterised protein [Vibrio cholerae]|nr:Uncharacterised protein [Vibrio cholerae]CSB47110.1 Uncharacterised protein [Vibrio cholerae]CSC39443.1 Uncharacterised protein [Vibrio cholerae]CSI08696.1 Uncharacterised protein [Vibrio cholerae]CSI81387.1 Uncharacterised protein [Vibrio cholerae]